MDFEVASKYPYINIGCGNRFHPDWTNIDIVAQGKEVIQYNLTKGIPFKDHSFEVVYHSHVIEHIPLEAVDSFIKDCYRILKPNGIIRIALPDLEQICKEYIKNLDEVSDDSSIAKIQNYEWIKLELLDQMSRGISGGEMKKFLFRDDLENEDYIIKRCGEEVAHILHQKNNPPRTLKEKIRKFNQLRLSTRFQLVYEKLIEILLTKIILWGDARKAYEIGKFRMTGEVHQWMYDRFSIKILLEKHGFKNITVQSSNDSFIQNWTNFKLDSDNKTAFKPDSLFIEAVK